MPCLDPRKGYRAREVNPKTGKRAIIFNPREAYYVGGEAVRAEYPCGQCIWCRLNRSRLWAIRCMHEASLWEKNCYITLTYDDKNLPSHGSLVKKDFQDFMKRLRKEFGDGIRYFQCGEYGEKNSRPHYHALLFNFDFPDRYHWATRNGFKYDRSAILERKWAKGDCIVGDVTFESSSYVARYITKKQFGRGSEIYYEKVDEETGEIFVLEREYATMSRRPGIARRWFEENRRFLEDHDKVILRGKELKPPRYYDKQMEAQAPERFLEIKEERRLVGERFKDDNTPERLRVKKHILEESVLLLKRGYENGT